ncbi:MAG: type III-B CRISPR module-associated protein Cmr5 [Desulfurococcaceae archaeon]
MDEKLLLGTTLECINEITSRYQSSSDIAKKVRTRARSIPEYSFTRGLAYTLVFIASKSGKDLVEIGLKAQKCKDIIDEIDKKNIGNEEKSYAIYGAVLLHIARKLGIVKGDKFEEVVYDIMKSPATEIKMWSVLDWLKRITEAYIHE